MYQKHKARTDNKILGEKRRSSHTIIKRSESASWLVSEQVQIAPDVQNICVLRQRVFFAIFAVAKITS